jgi:hypothetical protein
VKGHGVHTHDLRGVKEGAEFFFQPRSEEGGVAGACEEEGNCEGLPNPGSEQRSPWPTLARAQSRHPLPFRGVGITTSAGGGEATFIDVDKCLAAPVIAFPQAEIRLALLGITLLVPDSFFSERAASAAAHAKYKGGTR